MTGIPAHTDQPPTTSGTLGTMQPAGEPSGIWTRYARAWQSTPRELGFLLLTMPVAIIGLAVLSTLFWSGAGSIFVVFGVLLLVASLYTARGFGLVELVRLRWAGRRPILQPTWTPPGVTVGFWRAIFGPFANGHYWLYLLHGLIINPIVSVITWTITVTWLVSGLSGASFFIWGPLAGHTNGPILCGDGRSFASDGLCSLGAVRGTILSVVVGLLLLATLPLVAWALTALHDVIARGTLSAWRSEALAREVADLSESRGAAVVAEDRSLRRLERDIHDGPQQRLVRLQMDLASAERAMDADPDDAKALIEGARAQASEALDELRALSRGFAPPILEDRGLIAGLNSLASRSTVPVIADINLPNDLRLPSEIERNAYFVVSELLTNVARHSNATAVRLSASLRQEHDPEQSWLDLWVIDNGLGAARFVDGGGLRGLEERLRGLRGTLVVTSTSAGSTTVGAHIPLELPDGATNAALS